MIDRASPPKFENAPGLTLRPRKDGWEARWQARTDLVKRGYEPKTQQIALVKGEPSQIDRDYISDWCLKLQQNMLDWAHGIDSPQAIYVGTLGSLIECYRTDPDSRYRKARYRTRLNYDSLDNRVIREHGHELLADINARHLIRWHEEWTKLGVATAHSLMGSLRRAIGFGATLLELGPQKKPCPDCERLCAVMHKMKFKMADPRIERLTAEQATAIRARAHLIGWPSIALAQAFQFDLMLRQKDVIGEWVPVSEPGASDVISGNDKWLRGLRWSEINQNLILKHTTSKRNKEIEVDLKLAPMVMEELARLDALPRSGPVIVSELTREPYRPQEYRRRWRELATLVGIPKHVFNMDSRAGAISEATDAGADLEHVRHAATHSDISMTQRYSRGNVEKTANVMRMRVAHRNKPRTDQG